MRLDSSRLAVLDAGRAAGALDHLGRAGWRRRTRRPSSAGSQGSTGWGGAGGGWLSPTFGGNGWLSPPGKLRGPFAIWFRTLAWADAPGAVVSGRRVAAIAGRAVSSSVPGRTVARAVAGSRVAASVGGLGVFRRHSRRKRAGCSRHKARRRRPRSRRAHRPPGSGRSRCWRPGRSSPGRPRCRARRTGSRRVRRMVRPRARAAWRRHGPKCCCRY